MVKNINFTVTKDDLKCGALSNPVEHALTLTVPNAKEVRVHYADCSYIYIGEHLYKCKTPEDINAFLKLWYSGSLQYNYFHEITFNLSLEKQDRKVNLKALEEFLNI